MRLRSKLGKLGSQNSLQGSVRDKDRVTEEPCAVKVCAVERGAESLTQSREVRRNTSGPSDLPEGESWRGQEHVGKAEAI